jgi:hypothetical protein
MFFCDGRSLFSQAGDRPKIVFFSKIKVLVLENLKMPFNVVVP